MKYIINFFKNLFSIPEEKPIQNTNTAFEMLLTWDPYLQINPYETKSLFYRVFNTQDGQKILQILTNIVWIKKHEIKNDIATLAWHEGRQELMLWIFNILKTPEVKNYIKSKNDK